MKSLLLVLIAFLSLNAFAQKHMVEFNADSIFLGRYAYNLSKGRSDANAEEIQSGFLFLNYAYTVASHIQVGSRFSYTTAEGQGYESDSLGLALGIIYNLSENLKDSFFVSLYGGMEWDESKFNGFEDEKDEEIKGTFAIGKRFPLTFLNLENVTYSPQISYSSESSTKSTAYTDWEQELSFEYLNISILF